MVKVGNRNLSVNEARKMLTNWNRNVRESAVKGVWLMTQSKIQEIVNDFTIKGDKVKHKTKAVEWEYDLSDKGKVVPKEMKMKPKKEPKVKEEPKKEEMPKRTNKQIQEDRKIGDKQAKEGSKKLRREVRSWIYSKTEKSDDKPVDFSKDKIQPMVRKNLYKKKKSSVLF